MDAYQQFESLGRRQLSLQEGIDLMVAQQAELNRNRQAADFWGFVAVMANVTIIPLNAIINACELKGANTIYQSLVKAIYNRFGKSGTRIQDGTAKTIMSDLRKYVADELAKNLAKDYVPGVNIIMGFAEDSLAAWQTVMTVNDGTREMNALANSISSRINTVIHEMVQIGVKRAELLEKLQRLSVTA